MKLSIVTPSYNSEKYIRETIESVLSQRGSFDIEYIIVDGKSHDGTHEIIREYEEKLRTREYPVHCNSVSLKYISEKDSGMYDAINKGFKIATGDIFAYINADDIYLPGAFDIISKTFIRFPKIHWLKGITSFMNEIGNVYQTGLCLIYNQEWIKKGIYGRNAYFIHQDSVFWKKELWQKVGSIDPRYKLAGDYYLWIKFAHHAELWSLKCDVSYFRKRSGQLSGIHMQKYRDEQREISKPRGLLVARVKFFFWLRSKFRQRSLHPVFLKIYSILFISRKKEYVDLDATGEPIIKEAVSYIT